MPETIGQQLKQARKAKNLTIHKVMQATHIRAYQLEAMEADDFETLPSPVQGRAFLRLYAEYLGLSLETIIARQLAGVGDETATHAINSSEMGKLAAPDAENKTELSRAGTQRDDNKLFGLLSHIKRIVLRKRTPMPNEHGDQPRLTITNHFPIPMEQASITSEVKNQPAPSERLPERNKHNGILALLRRSVIKPIDSSIFVEAVEEGDSQSPPSEDTTVLVPEALPSREIFNAIGKDLRQRRESLSLTLDEIERHTHVRTHYLKALETGEFDRLPSSVQARGMLNNYASFLDLDVEELLFTFAEGLQAERLERQPKQGESPRKRALRTPFNIIQPFKIRVPAVIKRYFSVDIFVGGGLVILLLIFAIWGTSRILNMRAGSTPQPTAPSILNILVSTPDEATTSATPTANGNGSTTLAAVANETLALTIPAAGLGPVQVVLIAQDQAWVRVTVDGKLQFEGGVTAGTAYSYDGNTQIEVLTGNGRAISILYNQNNLGPMGNLGEIVDHIYTANAILNPTATFTSTPTITTTPTITLRPTLTLRPSITPRPSSTARISPTPGP